MKWYWWALIGVGSVGIASQINRKRVMSNFSKVYLGKNFTLSEFVKTSTGVENIPGEKEIAALRLLVEKCLQPLRDYLQMPITITSGFRSSAVNKAVPGSSNTSQHTKGEAADLVVLFIFGKNRISESAALTMAKDHLRKINVSQDVEVMHDDNSWIFKIPNSTIIDLIRRLNLPYDQLIDEQLWKKNVLGEWRLSRWIHWSYAAAKPQRKQWLTARNTQNNTKTVYATVNVG
jgi:Peptidase M15